MGSLMEVAKWLIVGLLDTLAFFKFAVPELAMRILRQKPVEYSFVSDKIQSSR